MRKQHQGTRREMCPPCFLQCLCWNNLILLGVWGLTSCWIFYLCFFSSIVVHRHANKVWLLGLDRQLNDHSLRCLKCTTQILRCAFITTRACARKHSTYNRLIIYYYVGDGNIEDELDADVKIALTERETEIRSYLLQDEPLSEETVEKFANIFWNQEPYKYIIDSNSML